jgi:hypothetical protein
MCRAVKLESMVFDAKLEGVLGRLARSLKSHYKARFGELLLLEVKNPNLLELMLVLEGEVNQVREILRVEPNARLASLEAGLEIAVLPVSRALFDAALEPELWEAKFTARVINAD